MITFLLLTVLAVAAVATIVVTVRSLRDDGPARPPRSHHVDVDFVGPASRAA